MEAWNYSSHYSSKVKVNSSKLHVVLLYNHFSPAPDEEQARIGILNQKIVLVMVIRITASINWCGNSTETVLFPLGNYVKLRYFIQ